MLTREQVWKLTIVLLKFIREASDKQLLDVAEYAAREMVKHGRAVSRG
jgi:hypothetical protein